MIRHSIKTCDFILIRWISIFFIFDGTTQPRYSIHHKKSIKHETSSANIKTMKQKIKAKTCFLQIPRKSLWTKISEPTVIIRNKKSTQKLIFRRSTKIVMNKDKWTQTNYPYLLQLPSTLLIIRHFITAVFSSPVGINPKKK